MIKAGIGLFFDPFFQALHFDLRALQICWYSAVHCLFGSVIATATPVDVGLLN